MVNSPTKSAFLITSDNIRKQTINLYHCIKKATGSMGDVFLLYHNTGKATPAPDNVQVQPFTDDILFTLGYQPLKKNILPGSNHFPLLNFYLQHPGYSHYWCIENDVAFNGSWTDFFRRVSPDLDYDFISSHIRQYADIPAWYWWNTFHAPQDTVNQNDLLSSFNPIYRISNRALKYIDDCLRNGYSGHHEVVLPTLVKKKRFAMADFGTQENHLTPRLSLCTLNTMRWKPVFLALGNKKNKLYHPVKEKITLLQFMVYIKRTILSKKRYLADNW